MTAETMKQATPLRRGVTAFGGLVSGHGCVCRFLERCNALHGGVPFRMVEKYQLASYLISVTNKNHQRTLDQPGLIYERANERADNCHVG